MRTLMMLVLALAPATSGCGDDPPQAAGETSPSAPSSTPAPAAAPPVSAPPAEEVPTRAVYYVGPGPDGPDAPDAALYRYDVHGATYDTGSILDPLTAIPNDPDYRTLWRRGSFEGVGDPEVGVSVVHLAKDLSLDRPNGMSDREAELALQQVAWTVGAAYVERPDLKLVQGNRAVDQVFGITLDDGLVRAAPALSVLSHVNIIEPAEGAVVGDRFVVRGLANGFEGTAACYLEHPSGSALWSGATIAGWQEERLFPFEIEVDLPSLPPGSYVLRCSNDDPTGGSEGRGSDTDSRTVVVREPGNGEPLQPIPREGPPPPSC